MPYANNKGAERCLDSIIYIAFTFTIPWLYLASVAEQAGLSLTWSKIPKTGFLMTRLIYGMVIYASMITYSKISEFTEAWNYEVFDAVESAI